MRKTPTPPKTLSKEGKALWRRILSDWPIDDSAHLAILESALSSLDRANRCRVQIDSMGELIQDRFGQEKINPLCSIERDSRSGFVNGIKALGLDPSEVT
jgi:phage terminase small subunit